METKNEIKLEQFDNGWVAQWYCDDAPVSEVVVEDSLSEDDKEEFIAQKIGRWLMYDVKEAASGTLSNRLRIRYDVEAIEDDDEERKTLAVLRRVAEQYGGRTIDNIIQNYESIIKNKKED